MKERRSENFFHTFSSGCLSFASYHIYPSRGPGFWSESMQRIFHGPHVCEDKSSEEKDTKRQTLKKKIYACNLFPHVWYRENELFQPLIIALTFGSIFLILSSEYDMIIVCQKGEISLFFLDVSFQSPTLNNPRLSVCLGFMDNLPVLYDPWKPVTEQPQNYANHLSKH